MIVAEHRIRDIIAMIPAIRINDNFTLRPNFHWGDEKELNRWIQEKAENAYPLIWLLPSLDDVKGRGVELEKKCEFIIATREIHKDLFNDERYLNSFDTVLNPLTEDLIHGLNASSISDLIGQEWQTFKFPNYSNVDTYTKKEKNGTIDLWDAIKLSIKVRFNNNCLNTIKYGRN